MSQSPEFTDGGVNYEAVFDQLPPLPADVTYEELERLATPLFEVPPQDQWATVRPEDPEQLSIRVPFTQAEADAIAVAQRAHRELVRVAASTSGVERDYWMEGSGFPSAANMATIAQLPNSLESHPATS